MSAAQWSGVTVDCADPRRLGDFWSVLLSRAPSESLPGWVRLGTHDDALPVICFQPVPEHKRGKTHPSRCHRRRHREGGRDGDPAGWAIDGRTT